MQKFIEWRSTVDHVGMSEKEKGKIRKEYRETSEYILGRKILDIPASEKQTLVFARIAEKRKFLRSKSS